MARGETGREGKTPVQVRVKLLAHGRGLPLPAYQSDEAAGLDLVAALGKNETLVIAPGGRTLIPTGLTLELPAGFEGQVRPRSGLALKHGVTVLNSPGTIDSDYRGEVKIILANLGEVSFAVRRGDRIAQLVVAPVTHAELVRVEAMSETRRGSGGFGSTRVGKVSVRTKAPAKPKAPARAGKRAKTES